MSKKIADAFKNKKAFISFITCGDPDLETTRKLIYALEKAGVDLIELGIPFSDPTAEGPVIQSANMRALKNNITTDDIFKMVESLNVLVPLVFMTYANIVYSYGTDKFAKRCSQIGMSGVILPDIPFEEKNEFSDIFAKYGLDFVSLIAPTSKDRIREIAKDASGFIYCVSSLGVTGMRSSISGKVDEMVDIVRQVSDLPVAIGFGISTPKQAEEMSKKADGVIVGSAIVNIVAEHGENSEKYVLEYVKNMVDSVRCSGDE